MRLLRSRLRNETAMRNGLEDFFAGPLLEFHYTFLMTPLGHFLGAQNGQKCLRLSRFQRDFRFASLQVPGDIHDHNLTTDSGKPMMNDTAIKISTNDLPYIRLKNSRFLGKTVIVSLLKLFKMILNALVVRCALGIALSVDGLRHGCPLHGSGE